MPSSGEMMMESGEIVQVNFDGDDWSLDVAQAWLEAYSDDGTTDLTQNMVGDELTTFDTGESSDLA